jgi:hypothetical protein
VLAANRLIPLPKTLYRAWAWTHRRFRFRINPSLLPYARPVRQLPHYAERFSPRARIEAPWENTRVNA